MWFGVSLGKIDGVEIGFEWCDYYPQICGEPDGTCDEGGWFGCELGTDSADCTGSACAITGVCPNVTDHEDCGLCTPKTGTGPNTVYSAVGGINSKAALRSRTGLILVAGSTSVFLAIVGMAVQSRRRKRHMHRHVPLAHSEESSTSTNAGDERP